MSDDKTLLIQRIRDGSIDKRKDLIEADLSGADLSKANLHNANLSKADLHGADFTVANLSKADLRGAYLIFAKLTEALLNGAELTEALLNGAFLSGAFLSGAFLSGAFLSRATLIGATLTGVDLSKADLTEVFLIRADLSRAVLVGTQALGTDFTGAILTGSCIEDWNINSKTKLDGVICDYVYLKQNQQERRPHVGTFAPGDFAKLVQSSLETIDLIFHEGLDWKALLISIEKLQVVVGDEAVSIRAIENKGDGDFVIRINVPEGLDKAQVEQSIRREYDLALAALTEHYQRELQLKEQEIASYRRENTSIMELAKLMASRPINVEAKAVVDSKSGDTFNVTSEGGAIASIGAKAESCGRIDVNQTVYQGEKQSLVEAAAEIQRLLKQLEETNPTATESEQVSYVNLAIKRDLKKRVIDTIKAGGETIIDEFVLENKGLKVVKSMLKEWLESDS
jgi:uncharacterized protein YjbI with pentapeptide repeats